MAGYHSWLHCASRQRLVESCINYMHQLIAKDTPLSSAVKRTRHDERSLRHAVHVAYRVRFQ